MWKAVCLCFSANEDAVQSRCLALFWVEWWDCTASSFAFEYQRDRLQIWHGQFTLNGVVCVRLVGARWQSAGESRWASARFCARIQARKLCANAFEFTSTESSQWTQTQAQSAYEFRKWSSILRCRRSNLNLLSAAGRTKVVSVRSI
jgi:hypothetical protein